MSEGAGRAWRFCIRDMIVFAGNVLDYTRGMDQPSFVANRLV